jgi:hypothetical protein
VVRCLFLQDLIAEELLHVLGLNFHDSLNHVVSVHGTEVEDDVIIF